MDLNNKSILITGSTDGIGRELANQLKATGANVIICGRSAEKCAAAEQDGFRTIQCDLGTAEGCDALVASYGDATLDILINNAGTQVDAQIGADAPLDALEQEMFLNYHVPVRLIAGFMPKLEAAREAMIVNVTSGLALAPKASSPGYCASKAGLRSFTKSLRYQLDGKDIHVVEALPPMVDTAMTAGRGTARMKISPQDCAAEIVSGMRSNRANIFIGKTKLLKRVQRLSPGLADRIMSKM
ncbi:SDR family NAD(P)-dependent oxidoreductase [Parasphingopyxis sp. CP4]|uniref:SDR family oxidoreductase n=1 Tax=Parasphingopyxis sp. CP4 TaxID=2724527 RepID=UPI0015A43E51|nr:SDR family NAD(P)-dependent oxidoreductase [Parasphingopyxis sp. CP4]QLC23075.1 SDR family NAD(P)-dependent oxidoreductase [Parasphingopyxis sp. CP4]